MDRYDLFHNYAIGHYGDLYVKNSDNISDNATTFTFLTTDNILHTLIYNIWDKTVSEKDK